jgi:hypothetical protein
MNRYALPLILTLLASAPGFAATISGTVTASPSGSALAGMKVAAYSPAGVFQAGATTDSLGRYTLLNVPAGQTRVLAYDDPGQVYATSYYPNAPSFETSQTFTLTHSQVVTGIHFALVRGGRIEGTVIAEATGVPLQEMTVAAYTAGGVRREQVTTDSGGKYSLLLPPGDFILASWDEQSIYLTEFYANVTRASLATPVSVVSGVTRGGHGFTLEIGARVLGTVKDNASDKGLAGMTISAWSTAGELLVQGVSGASGEFGLAVPPGKVRFVAHDNAGVYAGSFYNNAEAFSVAAECELALGQTLSGIDFRLAKGGTITGRVTDGVTAAGLPGLTVAVYNLSGTTRQIVQTNLQGDYTALVPPGYYKVAAYDNTGLYATQFWSKRLAFQYADTAVVLAGQPSAVQFSLPLAAKITGDAFNSSTGAKIGGVTVSALDSAGVVIGQAATDSSGAFILPLPAGTFKLVAVDSSGRYGIAYENGATSLESAPSRTVTSGQLVNGAGFSMTRAAVARRRAVRPASTGAFSSPAATQSRPPGLADERDLRPVLSGEYAPF